MRCKHIATLLILVAILFSSLGTGDDTEAKKKRGHRRGSVTSGISVKPSKWPKGCCWKREGTVTFRLFEDDRFADAFIQVVDDLNYMTAHMPDAPHFVFVNEPYRSCKEMKRNTLKWGIMICTVEPGEEPFWSKFAPAGCPDCATGWLNGKTGKPKKSKSKQPDG